MPPTLIAIAVVEHDGKFLIGLRPDGVALAGLWEFPGGKVQADETAAQAAVRECREETGLAVEVVAELDAVVHEYEHGQVELHFFRCRPLDASQKPDARFHWVPAAELTAYEFPAANCQLVARLATASAAP